MTRPPAPGVPARPGQAGRELCIGYVHQEALCWTFFRYHLLIEAKRQGVQVLDRLINTLEEQIVEIDALLRESIDVLMLRPVASGDPALLASLRRAKARGVQVIALDGSVGGGLDVTTVGIDNASAQAGVTDFICRRLDGRGRIAHLQGKQNMEAGRLRTQGLHGVLERYPGIDLVHEVELDWGSATPLRQQGAALTRAALAAHPALDAIISASDDAAFGAADALFELGLGDRVLVAGFDGLPEALIAIEDGTLEASVYQPLEMMAERAVHDAVRLVRHEPGVVTHTQLAAPTISAANLGPAALRALRLFPEVISDLEQRRDEQQASARFLETLIDNLPHQLFVKDAQTLAYIHRNRAADDWLGVVPGSYLGKTAFDIYPREIAERFAASDREILAQDALVDIPEEVSYLPGSGIRYMHTQKVPIFDASGKPLYLLGILQDITERRNAQTALAQHAKDLEAAIETLKQNREKLVAAEKMAALGMLVADVAHELNTPIGNGLMAISTLAESTGAIARNFPQGLSRSMLSAYLDEASDGARILERNLHRAAELLNGFKQIAVDQTSSKIRRFSLSTLVDEVLLTLTPSIRKTPFAVHRNVPDDIVLESYPGPLEQVLINLINNAIIHGLQGRASGQITLAASLSGHDAVRLVVEDDGRGIPDEHQGKVFTPFFTTRADDGGSGLGLSITHNIVTGLLGGEIGLTSTPGVGTRICLTLPLTAKPG